MPKKMRDYKVVAELGVKERKELEAKFLDQKSFSVMGQEEKVTLIKEYMYLQGKEETGYQKKKNGYLCDSIIKGDQFAE